MATRLTSFSKFLITLIVVFGIGGGLYYLADQANQGAGNDTTTTTNGDNSSTKPAVTTNRSSKNPNAVKVQAFTWGGYAGGQYFNEGFAASPKSRFTKEYGVDLDFVLIDDFDASRQAWIADEVHLLGTTADALPTEMERLQKHNPQILFQVDWSRGGDAIVAKRGVNSINDLKGKRVAFTPATPSQTFLYWMLDAAGMKMSDIKPVEVPSAIDAATAFKSDNTIDAAVVWSPDDEICKRDVPGAKIIQSTREASHIIADVYIAKKKWVDANRDKINKIYEGFMKGAAEINASEANKQKAAAIMAAGTGISKQDALAGINNVHLCTHGDNQNFFGRNPNYKGMTGEKLYTKMDAAYKALKLAPKNTPNWKRLVYPGAVSTAESNLTDKVHMAKGNKKFTPAPAKAKTATPISSKLISISFASGKYNLDENAKTIIDLQFSDIAKAFNNARIRVEGNTDDVGAKDMNVRLSKKRAESVAKYLESTYSIDPNRFVVVGNGPNKPVTGCENKKTDDCRRKNRRTEFQLIAD